MRPNGLCGAVILAAMAVHILLRLAAREFAPHASIDAGTTLESRIYYFGVMMAAGIAFVLCSAVARDYRWTSFLRWAWVFFSGDALMSFFRFAGEFGSAESVGMRNALVSAGLLCLLLGMVAMWSGLYRLPVVFKIERADIAGVALLSAFAVATLVLTMQVEGMTARLIPVAMIFLGAIGSFMLLRFSGRVQGGQISGVIRVLAVYLAVRCVLNFLVAIAWQRDGISGTLFVVLKTAMPWILTLAAGLRYDVILGSARTAREFRAMNAGHVTSF